MTIWFVGIFAYMLALGPNEDPKILAPVIKVASPTSSIEQPSAASSVKEQQMVLKLNMRSYMDQKIEKQDRMWSLQDLNRLGNNTPIESKIINIEIATLIKEINEIDNKIKVTLIELKKLKQSDSTESNLDLKHK